MITLIAHRGPLFVFLCRLKVFLGKASFIFRISAEQLAALEMACCQTATPSSAIIVPYPQLTPPPRIDEFQTMDELHNLNQGDRIIIDKLAKITVEKALLEMGSGRRNGN